MLMTSETMVRICGMHSFQFDAPLTLILEQHVHTPPPPEVPPSLWPKLLRCQAVTRQTQVQVPVVTS